METTKQQIACKHCGFLTANDFCCSGCETAYNLIHGSGLDQYYQIRSTDTPKPAVPLPSGEVSPWSVQVLGPNRHRIKIKLGGIDCPACSWLIERTPMIHPSLLSSRFSSHDSIVTVDYAPTLTPSAVAEIYKGLGFSVNPDVSAPGSESNLKQLYLRAGIALGSWISSMHLGMTLVAGHGEHMDPGLIRGITWFSLVISLPTLTYSSIPFYRNTVLGFRTRSLNIDFMVSLTLIAGFVLSLWNLFHGASTNYFEALNMLVFCLLISRGVSSWWENKTKNEILKYQSYSLSQWLRDVTPGEIIRVRTNETIPADGILVSGTSLVSEAWLSGESEGVNKSSGDTVYAGSVNLSTPIEVKVTASGMSTRIGKLIEDWKSIHTPNLSPPSRVWESRFIALTLFVISAMFLARGLQGSWDFQYAITLLIVACPCALGIAIPLGYSSALAQSLKERFFVQSGDALERATEVTDIVFDKTGTILTTNDLRWSIQSEEKEWIETLLATLPEYSNHAMIRSLGGHSKPNSVRLTLDHFKEIQGKGVSFEMESSSYFVGRSDSKHTNLMVQRNGKIIAELKSEPLLDTETVSLFQRLQRKYRVWLSTGDPSDSGDQLGKLLGIPPQFVLTNQKPSDKFNLIKSLHHDKRVVAMVGDGMNDVLAFKEADVRIGVGSQLFQALENCDIFLNSQPLSKLQTILDASSRLKQQVMISLVWAVLYNAIGFALIERGVIGPIVCAILMPLSSITVSTLAYRRAYFGGAKS